MVVKMMIIREFQENDVNKAASILAARHRRERIEYPSLNQAFEDVQLLENIIKEQLAEPLSIAIVAYEGDELLGFLISQIKTGKVFGRCAWIAYEGLGIADGVDTSLYRNLYADISKRWLELGCLKHYVIVPAGRDDVLNAWLMSSFSYEQVFGINTLEIEFDDQNLDIEIISAKSKHKADLESISDTIMSFQASSPTYAVALPEMFKELEKGYAGLVEDEEAHVLLAYENDKLLGFTCGYFEDDNRSNMMMPYRGFELGVAATNMMYQKKGVGTVLTKTLFNDALKKKYESSITDWRITNLKSSKFWPSMGYKPFAYRMVRTIDQRIYWANGFKKL